jgi:hypothetical protein
MSKFNIGDMVEVMFNESGPGSNGPVVTERGIVLEEDQEAHSFWPVYRIHFFERVERNWHYEYELTLISEATHHD